MTTAVVAQHVPETKFGKWFLRPRTWEVPQLHAALINLAAVKPG